MTAPFVAITSFASIGIPPYCGNAVAGLVPAPTYSNVWALAMIELLVKNSIFVPGAGVPL